MTSGPEPVATPTPTPAPNRPVQAETITTGVLVVATGIVVYLCYLVVLPFMPALAWALALAVIAHPMHGWLDRRMKSKSLCAGLTVAAMVLLLLLPVGFVTTSLVDQASRYAGAVQKHIQSGKFEQTLKDNKYVGPFYKRLSDLSKSEAKPKPNDSGEPSVESNEPKIVVPSEPTPAPDAQQPELENPIRQDDPDEASKVTSSPDPAVEPEKKPGLNWSPFGLPSTSSLAQAAGAVTARVGLVVSGVVWIGMQLLITMMCLFFFLRDRQSVLGGLKKQLPLSEPEADRILRRVNDTIYATIFGSLTVAFVQGCMGGFMFWMLGLPSPLFWGAMMGLLAVVPMLGTFVIWAPTAMWLALSGDWTRAIILTAWGGIAIGFIDNLLYPYLVGNRMRFHTLLVFFAIVGGLSVFGTVGIILGPVLLAVADGLLQVWHTRMDRARQAA
jgi:predicted PurR-regulated permease PerM